MFQFLQRLLRALAAWRSRTTRPPAPTTHWPALPPGAHASVVIPALNEARRIASVVAHALADPATAEVIVIDDSSIDDTAALARQAGARVVTSSMLGKGASMRDGVALAKHEVLVYLDGDLTGLRQGIVTDLCRPIRSGTADFVKARFGRAGGRVTELTAKPMLKVFFPEVAHFAQPLGGIVAARRSLLQALSFEDGYGVDVGLLIDAQRAGARLAEVDIGALEHDSQPLPDLAAMANEVSRVIYSRARAMGRLHAEQITAMYEAQRLAAAEVSAVLHRRRGRRRLLLLDMDGTLTTGRYIDALAQATGQADALEALAQQGPAGSLHERAAPLFRFVHQQQFDRVARALELRHGVVAFVNRMRRAGFMVGVVSESYFVAAEVVRKRVFADFALAHLMQFEGEVCTGELRLNAAFLPLGPVVDSSLGAGPCKSHVLQHLRADAAAPGVSECWVVGDDVDDLPLLRLADRAFCIDPKATPLRQESGVRTVRSLEEVATLATEAEAAAA